MSLNQRACSNYLEMRRAQGGTAEKGVSTVPVHGDWGRASPAVNN